MKQLQGKITFVGGGAMGEAIIGSLIGKKLLNPTQICVSEPVPTRREYLNSTYGVTTETDNSQAVTGASVAVLAVKPQVLGPVMADLNGNLSPAALVVSIMAGVQIDTLRIRSLPRQDSPFHAQHAGPGGQGYDRVDRHRRRNRIGPRRSPGPSWRRWARLSTRQRSITWIWPPG